ncbi:MAG: EAL domain-containing protein, partial [Sulfurovum sp.]|nr:EAL domain-containing protein [Sulfurovum sp.]
PIDSIKIDKSFVDEITKENSKAIILETIIAMGKTLDKNVIIEGVEHEYQRQYLLKHGCHFYQGYLFSKPLKESDYCMTISRFST